MVKFIDLTNRRFNRLVVLERGQNNKHGRAMWICKCDCGNFKSVTSSDLLNSRVRSCGCLAIEVRTKHNHSKAINGIKSRTYNTWDHMI